MELACEEKMKSDSDLKLVVVTITHGRAEAHIIKSKLESEGIPAVLKFEAVGELCGITMDGLGAVSILVPEPELKKAQEILTASLSLNQDE
jgi:hypothetical protein